MMNLPANVLCIERKPARVSALEHLVNHLPNTRWAGAKTDIASAPDQVVDCAADIVLLDLDLPGSNPMATVELLRHRCPETRTIVFSRRVEPQTVVQAFLAGAWGYVSKREGDEANDFGFFTVVRCFLPNGCFHLVTLSAR